MAEAKKYNQSEDDEDVLPPLHSGKVDQMLGQGTRERSRTCSIDFGELDIRVHDTKKKKGLTQSSSFDQSYSGHLKRNVNAPVDYLSQLNLIRGLVTKRIDRLVYVLQERKVTLLHEIDELEAKHREVMEKYETERKTIENLIEQANLLGKDSELRDQITRSSQRSLCKHACTSAICRDAKLLMKDYCNELENLGRITVSDHPNYTMRNQSCSFPVKHGKGDTEIGLGAGVSVADRLVYVVDSENNRVQVYSLEGNHSVQMKNLPKMNWPFGICVVGELVYVTQQQSHTLCMYSTSGELLSQAGGKGTGSDKLMKPSGLDVFESDVFVCDQENHRVQVFDARKLSHRRKMSIPSFNHPTDCHVAGSELLVLTMSDPCMHAFSLDGKHLRQLISWGPGKEVTTSNFFTVDKFGNIIVSEIGANCLKVFDRFGFFISKITCNGTIHQPSGVGLDSDGQMYLVHAGHKSQSGMVMMC